MIINHQKSIHLLYVKRMIQSNLSRSLKKRRRIKKRIVKKINNMLDDYATMKVNEMAITDRICILIHKQII
jgi:hypothetical protein